MSFNFVTQLRRIGSAAVEKHERENKKKTRGRVGCVFCARFFTFYKTVPEMNAINSERTRLSEKKKLQYIWVMNRLMGCFQIEPFCFSILFFFALFLVLLYVKSTRKREKKISRIHNNSLFSISSVFTATYYCCALWSVELLLGHFYHMSFLIMCFILRDPFGLSAHAQRYLAILCCVVHTHSHTNPFK